MDDMIKALQVIAYTLSIVFNGWRIVKLITEKAKNKKD